MKLLSRFSMFLLLSVIVAGCTRMPADYGGQVAGPVLVQTDNSGVISLVANARVGASQTFVDPQTGLTSQVTVLSEYFSANGRSCRRFSQHMSNAAAPVKKLGCKDQRIGWQEIPVSHIVDQ